MEIAKVEVGRTTGVCIRRVRIPAGIVGASVQVSFTDPVWDHLIKTVVFRGVKTRTAEFDGAVAVIPHEVVAQPGVALYFGIYGHDPDSDLQIPLIEVRLGTTEAATDANADPGTDPTLPIWAQLQKDVAQLQQGGVGPGKPGENGGYYTPAVEQLDEDTIQFTFEPSKPNMPEVRPVAVELPAGQGSGGNADQNAVLFTEQKLTEEQKAQARDNIGAATVQDGIELIETFTLSEDTSSIIRDEYPDGTPYGFRTVFISLINAQVFANKWIKLTAYYDKGILTYTGQTGGLGTTQSFDAFRVYNLNVAGFTNTNMGILEKDNVISHMMSDMSTNVGYHSYYTTTASKIGYNVNSAKITKLQIDCEQPIAAGAIVQILGVRA